MQQAIRSIGTRLNMLEAQSLQALGFYGVTRELARLAGASGAAILLLDPDARYLIQARAMMMDGELVGSTREDCMGTPCQVVAEGRELLIDRGLRRLFPGDTLCELFELEGYAGVPLRREGGKVFGLVATFFREPVDNGGLIMEVLRVAGRLVGPGLVERISPWPG